MAEAVGTSVSEVPIAATASNENVTAALPVKRRGRPKGERLLAAASAANLVSSFFFLTFRLQEQS